MRINQKESALRSVRRRAGLTIEQLAVRAGLARQTVFLAEKAPQLMSVRTARACADVLGVKMQDLLR
jgi:DNA-binding XRE family transcriptional regulator